MATEKQLLGEKGEILVAQLCSCPKCKRVKTIKRLRTNFKCADVICDFCGFVAQVKTSSRYTDNIPDAILGAAWGVQKDRMDSGIYLPLYFVQVDGKRKRISYLSADLQDSSMFTARKPLSADAQRAGWQGFLYTFTEEQKRRFVILFDTGLKLEASELV
jgi:predicted O-linked N-acetylglucosamine transferase (SPINDLY family)